MRPAGRTSRPTVSVSTSASSSGTAPESTWVRPMPVSMSNSEATIGRRRSPSMSTTLPPRRASARASSADTVDLPSAGLGARDDHGARRGVGVGEHQVGAQVPQRLTDGPAQEVLGVQAGVQVARLRDGADQADVGHAGDVLGPADLGVEAQAQHDDAVGEGEAGGQPDEQDPLDVRRGGLGGQHGVGDRDQPHGAALGVTAALDARGGLGGGASTTALAMSLAFCGDVEVAVTWMRGLDGSTW